MMMTMMMMCQKEAWSQPANLCLDNGRSEFCEFWYLVFFWLCFELWPGCILLCYDEYLPGQQQSSSSSSSSAAAPAAAAPVAKRRPKPKPRLAGLAARGPASMYDPSTAWVGNWAFVLRQDQQDTSLKLWVKTEEANPDDEFIFIHHRYSSHYGIAGRFFIEGPSSC